MSTGLSHRGWLSSARAIALGLTLSAGTVAAFAQPPAVGTDEVTLRRGAAGGGGSSEAARRLDGHILDATPAGLAFKRSGDDAATQLIGWQAVSTVKGPLADRCTQFLNVSDALWRVGQRLGRGDLGKAEEIAEPLYQQWLTQGQLSGPTGAMIAEAAMRCRLARGFNTGAVLAFLDLVTIARTPHPAGQSWIGWSPHSAGEGGALAVGAGVSAFGSALDDEWKLCPTLPPVFSAVASQRGLRAMVSSDQWARLTSSPGPVAELAALYRYSASVELGLAMAGGGSVGDAPAITSNDPAVVLVSQIVMARAGDAAQRAAMRQKLQARIIEQLQRQAAEVNPDAEAAGVTLSLSGSWVEAWCRLGVGRSLLREDSPKLRRQGMVELLHLPARFGDSLPELAGLALRDVIDALRADGDGAMADVLDVELKTRYPAAAAASEMGSGKSGAGSGAVNPSGQ